MGSHPGSEVVGSSAKDKAADVYSARLASQQGFGWLNWGKQTSLPIEALPMLAYPYLKATDGEP